MWILENSDNSVAVHYLLCGISLNVARQGKEHIVLSDKSISKRHASFFLTHEERNMSLPEKLPEVLLTDLHSTNGTFVNGSKVTPQKPLVVKHKDVINFGTNSCWRLLYYPFVLTTSQISSREVKDKLKEYIQCLGGHLLKDWTDKCNFLIMNDLLLTAKTVCALASGTYIVTPKYLSDVIEAVGIKQTLPDPQKYLPPLKEPSLNANEVSFLPDPSRKKLFSGKTFLFQGVNSYNTMKNVAAAAGASHALLSSKNYHKACLENHILIKKPEKDKSYFEEQEEIMTKVLKLMDESRLSLVPESDIGLAVVYKSTEKYCNPGFRINGILQARANQSQLSRDLVIYASETQRESKLPSCHPVSCTTILESGQSTKGQVLPSFPMVKPSNSVATSKKEQKQTLSFAESDRLSNTELDLIVKEELAGKKENLSKRKRSSNNEQSFVIKKQKAKNEAKEINTLAATEATTASQDVVDEGGHFSPMHFSTERTIPGGSDALKKKFPVVVSPIEKCPKKNIRIAAPAVLGDMDSSMSIPGNSRIPKSIPFEPYTLSSIHIRDPPSPDSFASQEEETQPFLIKQESQSQASQEYKEQMANPDENGWLVAETVGERSKERMKAGLPVKQEEVVAVSPAPVSGSLTGVEGEFALPFSTQRRRGREGEKLKESGMKKEEFHLPKRVKLADAARSLPMNNIERTTPTVEAGKAELNPRHEDNNRHSFFLEPVVKEEKLDKISGPSDALHKSLVAVEVLSLVKRAQTFLSTVMGNDGLPNFKKFKKVLHKSGMTALPRIIGGQALICHTEMSTRRESFLASQPELAAEIQRRDSERRARQERDTFDSDFHLVASSRQRRRARV